MEQASLNQGLGHEFLRHIERTKVILYVIDVSEREAVDNFKALKHELNVYNPLLLNKPALIFANKCDQKPKLCTKNIQLLQETSQLTVIKGSCKTQLGLKQLKTELSHLIFQLRVQQSLSVHSSGISHVQSNSTVQEWKSLLAKG